MNVHDWDLDNSNEVHNHGLSHNPGYDFRRIVRRFANDPPSPLPAYFVPVITLISACCAIEAYVDMVGRKYNPQSWNEFCRGPIPIKSRIKEVYLYADKPLTFSSGIYKDVTELFAKRIELVHPKYVNNHRRGKSPISTIFEEINKKYPPTKTKKITESAIRKLLKDTGLEDQWMLGSLNI